jgi:hypothetical protein
MNRIGRILTATLAGLALAASGTLIGYQVGHDNAETSDAQTLHDIKCSAVEGLSLTPQVPRKRVAPECVWQYQVSAAEWLNRALTKQCMCG